MPTVGSISVEDFDGQFGITGVNFPTVDPASADITQDLGRLLLLADAVEQITNGAVNRTTFTVSQPVVDGTPPDALSQRGNKWRVSYRDTQATLAVGVPNPGFQKLFDFEIPCADLTLRQNNSDVIYTPTQAVVNAGVQDLVDRFELACVSPYGGTVQVVKIEAVTRSGG